MDSLNNQIRLGPHFYGRGICEEANLQEETENNKWIMCLLLLTLLF